MDAAIVKACSEPTTAPRPIASAPRDGTVILVATWYDKFWVPACWQRPSPDFDDGSHEGEMNRWVYADWLTHREAGDIEPEWWLPMPPMPVPRGWERIETAPKDGTVVIVSPGGDGYDWGLANWGADTVRGEPHEGWWQEGLWMKPQPDYWLPIRTTPAPR